MEVPREDSTVRRPGWLCLHKVGCREEIGVGRVSESRNLHGVMCILMRLRSEKDEIDLQLRAVPDIEERIKELEMTSQ